MACDGDKTMGSHCEKVLISWLDEDWRDQMAYKLEIAARMFDILTRSR